MGWGGAGWGGVGWGGVGQGGVGWGGGGLDGWVGWGGCGSGFGLLGQGWMESGGLSRSRRGGLGKAEQTSAGEVGEVSGVGVFQGGDDFPIFRTLIVVLGLDTIAPRDAPRDVTSLSFSASLLRCSPLFRCVGVARSLLLCKTPSSALQSPRVPRTNFSSFSHFLLALWLQKRRRRRHRVDIAPPAAAHRKL